MFREKRQQLIEDDIEVLVKELGWGWSIGTRCSKDPSTIATVVTTQLQGSGQQGNFTELELDEEFEVAKCFGDAAVELELMQKKARSMGARHHGNTVEMGNGVVHDGLYWRWAFDVEHQKRDDEGQRRRKEGQVGD